MGLLSKTLVYGGFFALGFGVCYSSCVNRNYRVVEENGQILVEDKDTGWTGRVEDRFSPDERGPRKRLSSEEIGHDLKRRVNEAYDALTR